MYRNFSHLDTNEPNTILEFLHYLQRVSDSATITISVTDGSDQTVLNTYNHAFLCNELYRVLDDYYSELTE